MATKKQKREAGELKAKREAEERRQSGLAAQKASQLARQVRRAGDDTESVTNLLDSGSKHRGSAILRLVKAGKNPTTGEVFTDEEMLEMEQKANTLERRHMFEQIAAGRAGTLNEQPPLNMSDYTNVGVPAEMTVGEFRDAMDKQWEAWMEKLKDTPDTRAVGKPALLPLNESPVEDRG